MAEKLTVFDAIKNVNNEKNFSDEARNKLLKVYDPFVVNKALSLHSDTIFYSNSINMMHSMSKEMQYDYYMYSIRKRNRWAKWPKKNNSDDKDIIDFLSSTFNINYKNAMRINKLLTHEQQSAIRRKNENE